MDRLLVSEFGKEGMKAGHLIERLCMFLEDYSENKPIALDVLFIALSLLLDTSIEERLESLFELYENNGTISLHDLADLIGHLQLTCQLPVRVLTKEERTYPFNQYLLSEAEVILQKGIKEVAKQRKKDKTKELTDELKQLAELKQPSEVRSGTLKLTLTDLEDILLSRAVCVWGECNV